MLQRIFNRAKYVVVSTLGLLLVGVLVYLGYELITFIQQQSDDSFGRVRAILLTLAAVIGLPFLFWRTRIADRQNEISKESHYTELFAKAVELLGSTRIGEDGKSVPAVEARIGAIFALERLAKVSRTDYGPIIETLSAYVRDQCGVISRFIYDDDDPDEEGISIEEKSDRLVEWARALRNWIIDLQRNPPANRADIAAALTVLARRSEGRQWRTRTNQGDVPPKLSGANLQGANLETIMASLFEGVPRGNAPHLEAANLGGFNLDNSPAIGPIIKHGLTSSSLAPRSLVGASLLGLMLTDTEWFPVLNGADLSFAHMDDSICKNAHFRNARLINANFRNSRLMQAKFGVANASHAVFNGADLTEAEFLTRYWKALVLLDLT